MSVAARCQHFRCENTRIQDTRAPCVVTHIADPRDDECRFRWQPTHSSPFTVAIKRIACVINYNRWINNERDISLLMFNAWKWRLNPPYVERWHARFFVCSWISFAYDFCPHFNFRRHDWIELKWFSGNWNYAFYIDSIRRCSSFIRNEFADLSIIIAIRKYEQWNNHQKLPSANLNLYIIKLNVRNWHVRAKALNTSLVLYLVLTISHLKVFFF